MTLMEYQELAARTINQNLTPNQIQNHALFGMASEVGELHGIHQKYYQGKETECIQIMKELGDILWFIAEYCTVNGMSLEKIAERNIEKLRNRYPEGFSVERSENRDESKE